MDIKDVNLDIDSNDVISLKRSDAIKSKVGEYNSETLQVLLSQAKVIEKGFVDEALNENAKWLTIYSVADDSMEDTGALQGAILNSANKKRNMYGEQIDPDFDQSQAVKDLLPTSGAAGKEGVNDHDTGALEEEYTGKEKEKTVLDLPGPSSILPENELGILPEERQNWDDTVDNLFGGPNNDIGKLIKECIPCGLRKVGPLDFNFNLIGPWANFADRFDDLKNQLQALTFENEALDDICRLLGMLKFQCVPDLFGIISLFLIMISKYKTELSLSLDGLLSGLLGAILGPMLMNITSTIDQYIDAIMGPIECVLVSLEQQLAKLDIQSAEDKAAQITRNYENRKLSHLRKVRLSYERKLISLKNEKGEYPRIVDHSGTGGFGALADKYGENIKNLQNKYRNSTNKQVQNQNLATSGAEDVQVTTPGNGETIKDQRARTDLQKKHETDFEKNVRTAATLGGALQPTTRKEDMATLRRKISKLDKEISFHEKKSNTGVNRTASEFVNSMTGSDTTGDVQDARRTLRDNVTRTRQMSSYLKDSINMVIQGIYEGQTLVNSFLENMQDELIRTVFGRVDSKEDQITLAMTISKYNRLIKLVETLIQFATNNNDLKERCENKEAFGNFVSNYRNVAQGDNFDFHHATDLEGNDLLVVTPQNTKINVSGFEENDGDEDLLFGESITDSEKTSVYNEKNEAQELNKNGILPDLGNIGDKRIEVEFNDPNINLNISDNYVIMINDFCSHKGDENSVDSVKNWVNNL